MAHESKPRKPKVSPRHDTSQRRKGRAGGTDPAVEDLHQARQQHLAEYAADMAEPSGTAEQRTDGVDSATGYVGIIRDLKSETASNLRQDAPNPAAGEGHATAITGNEADHLAQIEAQIRSADVEAEAASEEMPGVPWVFPKFEIPWGRGRSGIDEARAFFEFSRRYATSQQPVEGYAPLFDGSTSEPDSQTQETETQEPEPEPPA